MSILKVQNIRDATGTCGLTRDGSTWKIDNSTGNGNLTVNTLQIDGTVTGNASNRFLPSQSGASGKILAAIHVTPEAVDNGVIGKIEDDDEIEIDANNGKLNI